MVALLIALASERTLAIDAKALAIPAAADAGGARVAINLIVSAEEKALLATIVRHSWTPDDPAPRAAARASAGAAAGQRGGDLASARRSSAGGAHLRRVFDARPQLL